MGALPQNGIHLQWYRKLVPKKYLLGNCKYLSKSFLAAKLCEASSIITDNNFARAVLKLSKIETDRTLL